MLNESPILSIGPEATFFKKFVKFDFIISGVSSTEQLCVVIVLVHTFMVTGFSSL